jgi:hypothetical protein
LILDIFLKIHLNFVVNLKFSNKEKLINNNSSIKLLKMVSNKVIVILIIVSLLLLVFSLVINISLSNNEINYEQEVPSGNPEASIGLIITPQEVTGNENG